MANHKSALKRIRQTAKRREHNRTYRNRARTFVKKAKALHVQLINGSATEQDAEAATRSAIRDLDMAVSRGVLHPRNAARRKSRLMKQLHAAKQARA
jgi:small subunit ribosomal protein S20